MIGYRLTGQDRRRALDVLHVQAKVVGVHEVDDAFHVWLGAEPPELGSLLGAFEVEVERLPDPQREWTGLEDDRAIRVGKAILVRPPWVVRPPGFEGIELVVPRGSAFGSGEHGSTRAALAVLEELWPEGLGSLADVGTGSGILALYGLRRGCPLVMACDLDPAAIRAARELLPSALVVQGGPRELPGAADAVVANLAAAELDALLEELLRIWTRGGPLVLSGMQDGEVGHLAARVPYEPAVFRVEDGFHALGWRGPLNRS